MISTISEVKITVLFIWSEGLLYTYGLHFYVYGIHLFCCLFPQYSLVSQLFGFHIQILLDMATSQFICCTQQAFV